MRIMFSKPKKAKIGSQAIMWKLGTEYSHVAVEFHLKAMDRFLIFESSYGDVHAVEAKSWAKDNIIVDEVCLDITKEKRVLVMRFLLDNLQKKYGYMSILGIAFPKLKLGVDGNKTFICSELVAKVLDIAYNYKVDKSIDYMTPKDIKQVVEQLEKTEKE